MFEEISVQELDFAGFAVQLSKESETRMRDVTTLFHVLDPDARRPCF
jgi:hypothetical protein